MAKDLKTSELAVQWVSLILTQSTAHNDSTQGDLRIPPGQRLVRVFSPYYNR